MKPLYRLAFLGLLCASIGGGTKASADAVANPQPPQILTPAPGAAVNGLAVIQASAADNAGLYAIEFSVDGVVRFTNPGLPYQYAWDTSRYSNGPHTLAAKALYSSGQSAVQAIQVQVANAGVTAVPTHASRVSLSGKQLMVERRLADGSLGAAQPYLIKGVTWNPATRAPDIGPSYSAATPSTQYGYFFDFAGRQPQGHDLMNLWTKTQFQSYYATDISLMAQMNVNTVRIFADLGQDPEQFGPVLDELYRRGIMAIVTVANTKDDFGTAASSPAYVALVNLYKNHPAILMWALGNEWNLNGYYGSYTDFGQAALDTQAAALAIKALDPNHLVSSVLGDRFSIVPGGPCGTPAVKSDIKSIVGSAAAVDIWGLNIYRGASFGSLFADWDAVTTKPFYFSEFGTDSFATTSKLPPAACQSQVKVTGGNEDEGAQSSFDVGLWNEIKPNLSANNAGKNCAGGIVHEFNDMLWLVGNYNVNLGGLVDYAGIPTYNVPTDDGFLAADPDGVSNAEHFGLVTADRQPKAAYNSLKALYASLTVVPSTSSLSDLAITGFTVTTSTPLPGASFVMDIAVTNQGTFSTSLGFNVEVTLDLFSSPSWTASHGPLAPGETWHQTFVAIAPSEQRLHALHAVVLSPNAESNPSNHGVFKYVAVSTSSAVETYLSDLPVISSSSILSRDRNIIGGPIILDGKNYEKGLGTGSGSSATFPIPAGLQCYLAADLGLDDASSANSTAVFRLSQDALFAAYSKSSGQPHASIGVGFNDLFPLTLDTIGVNTGGLPDWAGARLHCNLIPDRTPPVQSSATVTILSSGSVRISWTTDEPAFGWVGYGLTADYDFGDVNDFNVGTQHSVLLTNLTPNSLYHYVILSQDPLSHTAHSQDFTLFIPPSDTGVEEFVGSYYDDTNVEPGGFSVLKLTRTDPLINFTDWNNQPPGPGLPQTKFSVRWKGNFTLPSSTYTFTATADDGIRIFVDGKIVIDKWFDQPATTYQNSIFLSSGGVHQIQVDYFQDQGGAVAAVSWAAAPVEQIGNGAFVGNYYDDTAASPGSFSAFKLTRTDPKIDFTDWNNQPPAPGLPQTKFSVRWKGDFFTPESTYTFTATADDGIRVFIDGISVIDAWTDQPATTYRNSIFLSSGTHRIQVDYYQDQGGAVASVSWAAAPVEQIGKEEFIGSYYDDSAGAPGSFSVLRLTRTDPAINFTGWNDQPPFPALPQTKYSVRWKGDFTLAAGGYTFTATADDGIRVYLDGNFVIDKWFDQPATTYTGIVFASSGTHRIQVDYYQDEGGATARVSWAPNALNDTSLSTLSRPNFSPASALPLNAALEVSYGSPVNRFDWTFNSLETASVPLTGSVSSSGRIQASALGAGPGRYRVSVSAVLPDGRRTPPAQAEVTFIGLPSGFRVYPNPFRADRGDHQITFEFMPAGSTVKLFTISGHWVRTLDGSSGTALWNLANNSGDGVASGVYLYLITEPQGGRIRGKFAVIR